MEQSGQYLIPAPRAIVWEALNNPDLLAASLQGCEEMTRLSDDVFAAKVKAKIGPVSATFTADLKLSDIKEPESYSIAVSAKGGAVGFGKGTAHVTLEPGEANREGSTLLSYSVNARVGGKLAQVGSRLIDAAARKMADDFFGAFSTAVAPDSIAIASEDTLAKSSGASIVIWLGIGTAVLIGALVLLSVL